MLRVTFLGTGGSLPTPNRNPSAVMVNREGELMLFDCGEGTQRQMMRAKTGMMSLSSIFITHLHADHVLGIPGLIQTMSFQGREEPLTIYGPPWTKQFTKILTAMGYYKLRFEVNAVELQPGQSIRREGYRVLAVETEHGVPSLGYALVEDRRRGRFNKEKALELGVPEGPLFSKLHSGESVEVDGKTIRPEQVVGPPRRGRKIVYTGDTRPTQDVLEASRSADLLIHDGSLTSDLQDWAEESMHTTAREAAELARDAGVKRLALTHISSRYSNDTSPLLDEAREIFPSTVVARDLMEIEIPYPE